MSDDLSNAKVFVGRLPDGCTDKDLEDLFRTYGQVTQVDLVGKYGFVHMTKREEADEAIKKLNNYNFMGSQLTVQISTSKLSNTGKQRNNNYQNNNRRGGGGGGPMKGRTPYGRNNQYNQNSRMGGQNNYNRFGGPPPGPPMGPPNDFGPPYGYNDMNAYPPYQREPYGYPDAGGDPYGYDRQQQMGGGDGGMRSLAPYDTQPLYGRGGPAPPAAQRAGPPVASQLQPDAYGRGDGGNAAYTTPMAYDFNRSMGAAAAPQADPSGGRGMNFGGAVRNGYGGVGAYNANRGVAGVGGAQPPPPPPPTGRWQPY